MHHIQMTQTPLYKSSTESLSVVYDNDEFYELEADVENTIERESSRDSLIVEQGNSPQISKKLNLIYKMPTPKKEEKPEDFYAKSLPYLFKLKLEKISSNNLLTTENSVRRNAESYRSEELNNSGLEPTFIKPRNTERGSS